MKEIVIFARLKIMNHQKTRLTFSAISDTASIKMYEFHA